MKAVVVGSTFGSVYAEGIRIADNVELAGIVGRGSKRSSSLAAMYDVPFFEGVDSIPADIDLACVVVRSALVGGDGVEISRSLLERGIHVIQEQPMHSSEVLDLTKFAAEHGCRFMLNGFYPYLDSIRCFVDAASSLRKRCGLLAIDATACVQVAYPFVEVVGKVAGSLHPFKLNRVACAGPFDILVGNVGGIPLTVRYQNEMDSSDPDNNAIALMRINAYSDEGVLSLHDVYGDVVWSPRFQVGKAAADSSNLSSAEDARIDILHKGAETYDSILAEQWPKGIANMLSERLEERNPLSTTQFQVSACLAWQEFTSTLGAPSELKQRR